MRTRTIEAASRLQARPVAFSALGSRSSRVRNQSSTPPARAHPRVPYVKPSSLSLVRCFCARPHLLAIVRDGSYPSCPTPPRLLRLQPAVHHSFTCALRRDPCRQLPNGIQHTKAHQLDSFSVRIPNPGLWTVSRNGREPVVMLLSASGANVDASDTVNTSAVHKLLAGVFDKRWLQTTDPSRTLVQVHEDRDCPPSSHQTSF